MAERSAMNIDGQTQPPFTPQQGDRVDVVFYTDPLCCWSWAFQPVWQRFAETYQQSIRYRLCMGGMIPDWKTFSDPFNSVDRPVQMGALWMHVAEMTGASIDERIWTEDPPSSSYPACLAVKSAELQSAVAGQLYLNALQTAVMKERLNIAKKEVLVQVATRLSRDYSQIFDSEKFARDYDSSAGIQALKADLDRVRYHKIGRFPTVTMTINGKGLILTGYRPFEILQQALFQVAPAFACTPASRPHSIFTPGTVLAGGRGPSTNPEV